jgi:hypothetical protein
VGDQSGTHRQGIHRQQMHGFVGLGTLAAEACLAWRAAAILIRVVAEALAWRPGIRLARAAIADRNGSGNRCHLHLAAAGVRKPGQPVSR